MKTFVINLDKNPERLGFMRAQLERFGLSFERFPAVYGKTLSAAERQTGFSQIRSFIASKKKLSDAEIGVAMSHAGCYRKMVENDVATALIFEDDVRLADSFPETLRRVEAFLDRERPQIVVFSGYGVSDAETLPQEIRSEKSIWCADAYCLNLAAARLILKANWPVITVADSFKRWHRRFGLELYRALPVTVKQDDTTFKSENQVLPKSNWLVRNLMWVADWVLWRVTGR